MANNYGNNNGGNNNGGSNNNHFSCLAHGTIRGRLAKDPEVKYVEQRQATVVSARVLVNKKGGAVDSWKIEIWKNDNAEFASSNFRALAEFAKQGRFVTVTGDIWQNNTKNQDGSWSNFPEVKPVPGGIILDSGAPEGGSQGGNQGGNNYQSQNQGAPQGNGGANNFGAPQGQPQGNNGGGGFGQPQGNNGGNFGQPAGAGAGAPGGGAPGSAFGR